MALIIKMELLKTNANKFHMSSFWKLRPSSKMQKYLTWLILLFDGGSNLVMKVGFIAELASVVSFLNLWWMTEDWGQTPFQAEGERGDVQNVQEAKNQINHPSEIPDQY